MFEFLIYSVQQGAARASAFVAAPVATPWLCVNCCSLNRWRRIGDKRQRELARRSPKHRSTLFAGNAQRATCN